MFKDLNPAIFPPTPITDRYKDVLTQWDSDLTGYYDKEFIMNTITNGVKLGIDETIDNIDQRFTKDSSFMDLNFEQTQAIAKWIVKGVDKGYIAGPYPLDFPFPFELHTVPLFVVPKPKKGQWRTIAHASYRGKGGTHWSVNDLIKIEEKRVSYVTNKEIVQMMQQAGPDAWLWVVDAEDAYYRLPIHPSQYKYVGLKWGKKYWLHLSHLMGVGSAPRHYSRFADAIEYAVALKNKNIAFFNDIQMIRHYIDDFFGANKKKKHATRIFNSTRKTFKNFNIPTRDEKCKWPAQSRKILGKCLKLSLSRKCKRRVSR